MGVLEGWARKVALPLLCISAIGWIVYVVGVSLLYHAASSIGSLAANFTPHWMFLGSGILMYILSILYLLFGNSILGLATNFFTVISLATGGMVLFYTGLLIRLTTHGSIVPYAAATFAGCLIAELFLGISMLFWPFFIINQPEACINLTEEDRRAFSGRHSHHFQPEGSSQHPAYSQLAQTESPPQAVQLMPVAAALPGYMPASGSMASTSQEPKQY